MKRLLPKDKEAYFNFASKNIPSVREAAHVIGLLVSAFPAVLTVICSIIGPLNRVNLKHCLRI